MYTNNPAPYGASPPTDYGYPLNAGPAEGKPCDRPNEVPTPSLDGHWGQGGNRKHIAQDQAMVTYGLLVALAVVILAIVAHSLNLL